MSLLAIEPEIVARLRDVLPESVHILTAATMATVARHLSPVVGVLYQGASVSALEYNQMTIVQDWAVVSLSRNVADASGSAARADAGALADLVLAALQGWQPASAAMPMTLSSLPAPEFEAGVQLVPLVFSTEIARDLSP